MDRSLANSKLKPPIVGSETEQNGKNLPESAHASEPWTNRQASARALRAAQARNQSARRRHVDPATCERDYSLAEIEFMNAMADYKKRSGRMFPTWSEVLEVLHELGYRKGEVIPTREAAAV